MGGTVDLSDNFLTGRIPTEVGQMTSLRTALNLSSNRLSGTIPTELEQLVNLQLLQLHRNALTGTIPSSFGELSQLRILQLEYNNLVGEVADPVCYALVTNKIYNGIFPTTLFADCSGEVDCECCQYCCSLIGGCKCQYANTDKDYLCRYGDVIDPNTRMGFDFG